MFCIIKYHKTLFYIEINNFLLWQSKECKTYQRRAYIAQYFMRLLKFITLVSWWQLLYAYQRVPTFIISVHSIYLIKWLCYIWCDSFHFFQSFQTLFNLHNKCNLGGLASKLLDNMYAYVFILQAEYHTVNEIHFFLKFLPLVGKSTKCV